MRLLAGYEFPWDYQRSLVDMVFLRVLAAPRIAGVIGGRGYIQRHTQKRYDDTAIMIIGFVKNGYNSDLGAKLIARMNDLHSHFHIRNEDHLYVLTALMVEPVRWNARFGWRRMVERERAANYYFWREVGLRMGIVDIPDDYDACERSMREYERKNIKRTAMTVEVSEAIFAMLESWMPPIVRPAVRPGLSALFEEEILSSFGVAPPPAWLRTAATGALALRGKVLGWLPADRKSAFFVDRPIRSYPHGYEVTDLGPPDLAK